MKCILVTTEILIACQISIFVEAFTAKNCMHGMHVERQNLW